MRTRRMVAVAATLIVLATAVGCAGRGRDAGSAELAGEPVVSVRVCALEVRRFEDVVTASGQWRSGGDLVLSAPFGGVVETLTARVGDAVDAEQRVGTLITRESGAALRGAELMVREARDASSRAEAERALALARSDLIRVPLVAARKGVVVRRSIEPGAQIAEGSEILVFTPWAATVFEAHVASDQVSRVRPGQPATVSEAGGASRAAVVQRVLPMASGSDQASLVWLALRGAGPPPALDRFGTAAIVVGAAHKVLALPDSALVEDDLTGERRVAVVDSAERVNWTPVVVGAAEGGWHEIRSPGLAPGVRVVIEGQRGLPGGTRVKPQS